ncbi:MAG: hypothetical protein ACTS5I_18315, partial [Rhodanobacter sp.]
VRVDLTQPFRYLLGDPYQAFKQIARLSDAAHTVTGVNCGDRLFGRTSARVETARARGMAQCTVPTGAGQARPQSVVARLQ